MATGKKHTSATSSTFGARPKPSTRTTSGAITGTGTACEPITSGRSADRARGETCMTTPIAAPAAIAAARPSRTSQVVTARSGAQQRVPVGQQYGVVDVVRDEQDRARLAPQRGRQPALHLPARERVE